MQDIGYSSNSDGERFPYLESTHVPGSSNLELVLPVSSDCNVCIFTVAFLQANVPCCQKSKFSRHRVAHGSLRAAPVVKK